jgi:hypothetical protein
MIKQYYQGESAQCILYPHEGSFVSILSMKHRNAASFRFIDTEGFGGQVISHNFAGPRTAAAADFDELAPAAFVIWKHPPVFYRGVFL